MTAEEIIAAALNLTVEERISLIDRVEESLWSTIVDPADREDSLRIMREIVAGRMGTVPAEQVLASLEYDPNWLVELNRRINEVEEGTAVSVPAEEVLAKLRRAAWLVEADRRMELVRAGKMQLIDADEVLEDPDDRPKARS